MKNMVQNFIVYMSSSFKDITISKQFPYKSLNGNCLEIDDYLKDVPKIKLKIVSNTFGEVRGCLIVIIAWVLYFSFMIYF